MMNPRAEGETANPTTEGESKKMSKRARWRRNKKKNLLLTEAAEVRDSSADTEEMSLCTLAEKEEVPLCALICDLLFCFPRSLYKSWDDGITRQLLVGLKKCAASDWCGLGSNAVVDLRGQSELDAGRFLASYIFCASRELELRYLKVRVGCKQHGLGQGKLKKEIIKQLSRDPSVKWVEEDNGTIISIELDGSLRYVALGWYSRERDEPLVLEE